MAIGMGIRGSNPGTADILLAVVRMMDDLRDAGKRKEILGELIAEYGKIEIERAAAVKSAESVIAEARSVAKKSQELETQGIKIVSDAKVEAERLLAAAKTRIAECEKEDAIRDSKLREQEDAVKKAAETADKTLAEAVEKLAKAEEIHKDTRVKLAQVERIQEENSKRAAKAVQLVAALQA